MNNNKPLAQHLSTVHVERRTCPHCNAEKYTSERNFNRHVATCYANPTAQRHRCNECGKQFARKDNLLRHELTHFNDKIMAPPTTVATDPEVLARFKSGQLQIEDLFKIEISKDTKANSRKLIAREVQFQIDFTKTAVTLAVGGELYNIMKLLFDFALTQIRATNTDLCQIVLDTPGLDYPLTTGVRKVSEMEQDFDNFMESINRVAQSKRIFNIDASSPEATLTVLRLPMRQFGSRADGGQQKVHAALIDPTPYLEKLRHRGITTNCLVASICLSRHSTKRECEKRLTWDFINQLTKFPAEDKVTLFDFEGIGNITTTLFEAQLIIIDDNLVPIYTHKQEEASKVYVVAIGDHTYACPNITNYAGAWRVCHCGHIKRGRYFCYNSRCRANSKKCARCNSNCKSEDNKLIRCDACNMSFAGQLCFDSHRLSNCEKMVGCRCLKCSSKMHSKKARTCPDCLFVFKGACIDMHRKTTCALKAKCKDCGRIVLRENLDDHHCRQSYCVQCRDFRSWGHVCMVLKPTLPDNSTETIIIFDFETVVNPTSKRIEPIFVYGIKTCKECIGIVDSVPPCCPNREFNFSGRRCLNDVMEYIMQQEDCLVLSFCGSKFDNILLFEDLIQRKVAVKVMMRGQNLLVLRFGSVVCKDVYLFLPSSLQACAREFGLKSRKSFFPLKLLSFDTIDKSLLLCKADFGYEVMSTERKHEFMAFYKQHVRGLRGRKRFKMKQHLLDYCRTDVIVLHELVAKFRSVFMSSLGTKIDPFIHASGLPSLCALLYRIDFMPRSSIQLIGDTNCIEKPQKSRLGDKYLYYLAKQGHVIEKEKRITGRITADGFEPSTKTAHFIDGCMIHACSCQGKHGNARHPLRKPFTYREIQELDIERNKRVTEAQFNIDVVRECQILAELRQNAFMQQCFAEFEKMNPMKTDHLRPREAVFGGRTGACALLIELTDASKFSLKYKDIVSLYPSVQMKCPLPVGKFRRQTCDQVPAEVFSSKIVDFGLYYCIVLPNPTLYFPVLPVHINDRLVFTSCYACAARADHSKTNCEHSPSERQFPGVYTSAELNVFLERGGRIVHIFETWLFKSTTELFAEYVRKIARIKIENSGWPENTSERERKSYISRLYAKTGIQISYDSVKSNKALRAVSKNLLNSTWGKCAERPSTTTKIITEGKKVIDLFKSGKLEHTRLLAGNSLLVTYSTERPTAFNNLALAAFVTSWARIELLRHLESAHTLTAYYDTDSILYLHDASQPDPVPSSKLPILGEMKDEHPTRTLTKYCSAGSKSYGIGDRSGWEDVKFKGIQAGVSYSVLRSLLSGSADMVYDESSSITQIRRILDEPQCSTAPTVNNDMLRRCIFNPVDGNGFIKACEGVKFLKLNFTNRRIIDPKELNLPGEILLSSVPWGYRV